MIKRPNTVKMRRLLEEIIECRLQDRRRLRELQQDASRVLGFLEAMPATAEKKKRR